MSDVALASWRAGKAKQAILISSRVRLPGRP